MAEIYEASEETKRIIQDWLDSPFDSSEKVRMPESWFMRQPLNYQNKFSLDTRKNNTPAWEEAAITRRNSRKSPDRQVVVKPKVIHTETTLPLPLPEGAEHLYVVKIEGNTNITGYGFSTNMKLRAQEHTNNTTKDGSGITQWDTFGFDAGVAKAVEKLLIRRFPLEDCTISGFQKESTHISRYDEVVEFVAGLKDFIGIPIREIEAEKLPTLH